MIKKLTLVAMSSILFFACNKSEESTDNSTITLTNNFKLDKSKGQVVLSKDSLTALVGETPDGKIAIITSESGEEIPSQCDDLDGDGIWDEFAFVVDIPKNSSIKARVSFVTPEEAPSYTVNTNVRLGVDYSGKGEYKDKTSEIRPEDHYNKQIFPSIYQSEGPMWENEKVAFRTYFDERNGRDIFGKIGDVMVIDTIGIKGSYHNLQSWGLDILKVGNSLGAGALAIYKKGKMTRLGATKSAKFDIITEGPVRSIFKLTYEGLEYEDTLVNITDEIHIWTGTYYYNSNVTFSGLKPDNKLMTGIVNLKSDGKVYATNHNKGLRSIATHCVQSDNYGPGGPKNKTLHGDILGMAVIYPWKGFAGYDTAPKENEEKGGIVSTEYVKIWAKNDTPISYYFVAGWEQSNEQFKTKEGFIKYLQTAADHIYNPIVVSK